MTTTQIYDLFENELKEYVSENYPDWNIEECINNGDNVEICENGDVVYNSLQVIKTEITIESFL